VFLFNAGGLNTILMKMSYSIIMLIVIGGTRFRGVELVRILIITGGLLPIVNSWTGYVVNK